MFTMSGRILTGMILISYVAARKPGAVAAEARSSDVAGRLERLEQLYQDTDTATVYRSYGNGDRVLFDSALTNYGDAYDSVTSVFTCSVTGYYLFSVAVMADSENEMRVQIQLEETPLVSAYAWDWGLGTNMVVTHCAAGETVWVFCINDGGYMRGGAERYSVFTGTLLSLA